MHNIYYETQNGGLCRKHSINAFFGAAKISTDEFHNYQKEYDIEYKKKFNFDSECAMFDMVASNQKNIVSFILNKHGVYTRYYALNYIFKKNINNYIIKILEGDFFFIYNESHIYGARRKNDKWYTVNSMGGVRLMNINSLTCQKNIGFIVPVNMQNEFYCNLKLIKDVLNQGSIINYTGIKDFLIAHHRDHCILGVLEIPLGICMDVLETKYRAHPISCEFNPINEQVVLYNEFLSKFTNGRYNDIDLILKYLPEIILNLTGIGCDNLKTIT